MMPVDDPQTRNVTTMVSGVLGFAWQRQSLHPSPSNRFILYFSCNQYWKVIDYANTSGHRLLDLRATRHFVNPSKHFAGLRLRPKDVDHNSPCFLCRDCEGGGEGRGIGFDTVDKLAIQIVVRRPAGERTQPAWRVLVRVCPSL